MTDISISSSRKVSKDMQDIDGSAKALIKKKIFVL